MLNRRAIGRGIEREAARLLASLGFEVIRKNFTCRNGEIDLIALHKGEGLLVFWEVRSRNKSHEEIFGRAELSITESKKRHIFLCAQRFLQQNPQFLSYKLRFDLLAASLEREGSGIKIEWRHFENIITESFE